MLLYIRHIHDIHYISLDNNLTGFLLILYVYLHTWEMDYFTHMKNSNNIVFYILKRVGRWCVSRALPSIRLSGGVLFRITAGAHRVVLLLLFLVRSRCRRVCFFLRDAVYGWIGGRIVTQFRQHGRDVRHVADHVVGYLTDPFGQRFLVQGSDHLVGRTFHPAQILSDW